MTKSNVNILKYNDVKLVSHLKEDTNTVVDLNNDSIQQGDESRN